ncbi:MAG: hypothetical protein HYX48_08335 [Chlamydiales bacterium]|nr:hypothetical protein [Chlamydiales bacterium]
MYVVSCILSEPISTLRAFFEWLIYGWGGEPHFSGVNPTAITEEQRRFNPVLCLHGNYNSPASFTSIAAAFQEDPHYHPAVFTVSLPHGEITAEDRNIINTKMAQIRALFGSRVEIDLIGHSRGGALAYERDGQLGVGRVILLGTREHGNWNRAFSIHGTYDNLIGQRDTQLLARRALSNPEHIQMLQVGHTGLLFAAGPQIIRNLSS